MTSSVTIDLLECYAPWTVKEIKAYCNQFQYGHFDGMTDCYEYSNNRDDLPQAKFVFVNNGRTDADRQKAYDYLRANFAGYDDKPENYEDAANLQGQTEWVSTEVHQVLSGMMDKLSTCKYWEKPRVKAA